MTVPLIVSVAALVWAFRLIDDFATPVHDRLLGRNVPGLGVAITGAFVLVVGAFATNVLGKRLLQRGEGYPARMPVFKTVYAPVKQLLAAFSPDNDAGFKRVVLARTRAGRSVGFLTREFTWTPGKATAGRPSWPSTSRPTTSIWETSSSSPGRVALPGPVGRGRHPDLPDGRDGAADRLTVRPDEAGHLSS